MDLGTGMNYDQITDFERIRDYGLMVVFSNWSYLKNGLKENNDYKDRELGWVAYIAGKRESRRLLGDYILKEDDLRRHVVHEDGSAATTWSIDLHYPDPKNAEHFKGNEFKSIARHIVIHPYPIPYRCPVFAQCGQSLHGRAKHQRHSRCSRHGTRHAHHRHDG